MSHENELPERKIKIENMKMKIEINIDNSSCLIKLEKRKNNKASRNKISIALLKYVEKEIDIIIYKIIHKFIVIIWKTEHIPKALKIYIQFIKEMTN